MATEYATLIEHNEWEGETWRFYIPIQGNQEVLNRLLVAFDGVDEDEFELDLAPVPESEVDTLVKHGGDTTYMAAHNKLAGVLVLGDELLAKLSNGDVDPLYKGRIADHMKATAPS